MEQDNAATQPTSRADRALAVARASMKLTCREAAARGLPNHSEAESTIYHITGKEEWATNCTEC